MKLSAEKGAIMPLENTQSELDSTGLALSRLWQEPNQIQKLADKLAKKTVRQVILVGSGDSLSIALMAALDMEQRLGFPCRAYQAYEFLQNADAWLAAEDVVIAISASGRPSPVVDALKLARNSPAMTVGLTDQLGNDFSRLPEEVLFTNAVKTGIPTQSSTTALLCLILLTLEWANRCGILDESSYRSEKSTLENMISTVPEIQCQFREIWQQHDRTMFFNRPVVFIDTGCFTGMASLGANLLACGPQLFAQAYLLEEYHHSLRLYITQPKQLFILFASESSDSVLVRETHKQLLDIGAQVLFIPSSYYTRISRCGKGLISDRQARFLHILFLQELSLQLAQDFVDQGGVRATILTGEG